MRSNDAPGAPPRAGWNVPKPETAPPPTAWPIALAFGATLLCWGLVSSAILSIAGVLIFAVSLAGWIGEMRRERNR